MADDFDYDIDGFDDDAWLYVDDEFDLAVSDPCTFPRVPAAKAFALWAHPHVSTCTLR
jgi:hypothetical protein